MIKTVCSGGWLWNIEQFGVLLVSSVPSFYFQFECQCTWMVFRCFSTALHSFSISFAMWHSLVALPKLHSGFFPPLCPAFLFLSVLVYVLSHGVFCLTLRSPLVFFRLTGLPADCRMAVSQNFAPMEAGLLQNQTTISVSETWANKRFLLSYKNLWKSVIIVILSLNLQPAETVVLRPVFVFCRGSGTG